MHHETRLCCSATPPFDLCYHAGAGERIPERVQYCPFPSPFHPIIAFGLPENAMHVCLRKDYTFVVQGEPAHDVLLLQLGI